MGDALTVATDEMRQLRAAKDALDERLAAARLQAAEHSEALNEIRRRLADKKRVFDVMTERLEALSRDEARANKPSRMRISSWRRLRPKPRAARRRMDTIGVDKERFRVNVDEMERELALLRRTREELDEARTERHAAWVTARARTEECAKEIDRLSGAVALTEQRLRQEEAERQAVEQRKSEAVQEIDRLQAQLTELKAIAKAARQRLGEFGEQRREVRDAVEKADAAEREAAANAEQVASALHRAELQHERDTIALEQIEEQLAQINEPIPTDVTPIPQGEQAALRKEAAELRGARFTRYCEPAGYR